MRLNKRKHTSSVDLNMTPMIDVVFLLLIFFMTVSQVSEINHVQLELPKLKVAEDQQTSQVTINITRDGQYVVAGATMSLAEFVGAVSDQLAQLNDDPSRLAVTIRADERGESRGVNDVIRALARLDVTRVRIAVQVPEDGS